MKSQKMITMAILMAGIFIVYGANSYAESKKFCPGMAGAGDVGGCPHMKGGMHDCGCHGEGECSCEDCGCGEDCECGMGMGKGGEMMGIGHGILMKIGKLAESLNLTPEQKEKIKSLRSSFREKVAPLREKIKAMRQQIIQELKKIKYNRNQILSLHEEIKNIRTEIEKLHFNLLLDIYDTLTDAQKSELWKKIENFKPLKNVKEQKPNKK